MGFLFSYLILIRVDNFLSQCNALEIRAAFPGKSEQLYYGATQLLFFLPVCSGFFSCLSTTGCDANSFTTDGYGIFYVRTNLGACHTHEGGSGTNN